jgi:hypothetical protein
LPLSGRRLSAWANKPMQKILDDENERVLWMSHWLLKRKWDKAGFGEGNLDFGQIS